MIQFDTVIGNPPYSGSLHLDIISSVLPFMSKRATGCFVHPATWLINIRKTGKAKKYDDLKNKLKGHIKSIDIENKNREFNTELYVPLTTTTIDMNKNYKDIDYTCCGEHRIVKSLYDCNLIGDYNIIWSIFDKVKVFGDMMRNHTTKKDMGPGYWYAKYQNILGQLCQCKNRFFLDAFYVGDYWKYYYYRAFDDRCEISDKPLQSLDNGGNITDKIADNIYGTKEELENWKHFIFHNKLSLFLNIVLSIDQHNESRDYLPWLVDKQYTDEEINKKFKFTNEEIKLIDDTVNKFERHSPWFKRYMCGKEDIG